MGLGGARFPLIVVGDFDMCWSWMKIVRECHAHNVSLGWPMHIFLNLTINRIYANWIHPYTSRWSAICRSWGPQWATTCTPSTPWAVSGTRLALGRSHSEAVPCTSQGTSSGSACRTRMTGSARPTLLSHSLCCRRCGKKTRLYPRGVPWRCSTSRLMPVGWAWPGYSRR